jgi:hypothetical protein
MSERLTKRDENGNAYYDWGCLNRNHWALGKHVDRLAAYEDSGLSPEEVHKLVKVLKQARESFGKTEIIEEDKPIEKLEKIPTSAYHFGKGITYCNFTNEQNINVLYLKNKINEIIDVVNELKESRGDE